MLEIAVLVLGMVILMVEAFATKIDKRVLGVRWQLPGSRWFFSPVSSSLQLPRQPSDRFLEFLHRRSAGDLLQTIRAADHNPRADHDDRLRAGRAQFLSRRHAAGRSRRIFRAAAFHLCRADVPGFGDRFRLHLCLARAGDDFVLRAGQFHPAQSDHARSGNEISGAQRALHGVSRLRNRLDFRRDRPDQSAPRHGGAGESGYGSQRSVVRHGACSGRARFQDRGGAIPNLGAGCLSRRADAGDCVSFRRFESGGLRRAAARVAAVPDAAANATADCS